MMKILINICICIVYFLSFFIFMIYKVNFKVKKILNKKNKNIDCFFFFFKLLLIQSICLFHFELSFVKSIL